MARGLPPMARGLPPMARGLPPMARGLPPMARGHSAMTAELWFELRMDSVLKVYSGLMAILWPTVFLDERT